MNYKVIALMIVCIAVVAAAGCTGISPTVSSAGLDKSVASPQSVFASSSENAVRMSESAGGAVPVPTSAPSGSTTGIDTKIIRTAFITLEVKDVTGSVDTLKALVTAKGGYLSSSNIQAGYNNRLSGTVVLRIPQAEFENTLTGVKAIGTVKSVSTQGEDVT
jgi:hypothetical protein